MLNGLERTDRPAELLARCGIPRGELNGTAHDPDEVGAGQSQPQGGPLRQGIARERPTLLTDLDSGRRRIDERTGTGQINPGSGGTQRKRRHDVALPPRHEYERRVGALCVNGDGAFRWRAFDSNGELGQ
jgi:hypothetical protein